MIRSVGLFLPEEMSYESPEGISYVLSLIIRTSETMSSTVFRGGLYSSEKVLLHMCLDIVNISRSIGGGLHLNPNPVIFLFMIFFKRI